MSLLSAAAFLKPFGLGFAFLCLGSVQQCNAFYRRPLRASATSLLLGVCVFAQWAVWSAKRNDRGHTVFALGITILTALLIVNAQAYIYHEMDMGIADGTYQVMFYAITGMFLGMMIVGILFSLVTAFRFTGGRTGDREIVAAHAIYWYTTAAVFTALWFVVYVTK